MTNASRTMIAVSFCAISILLITGCLVGPDYRPPERSMPAEWVSLGTRPSGLAATRVSVITADPADTSLWWKQFNDHTLDRLIFEALRTNLDIAQAKSRLQQARASRAVIAGGLWPSVDLSGSY